MHILITGGTGFIGSALTQHYIAQGHKVTVLTRHLKKVSAPVAAIASLDALDSRSNIDVIINLAGAPIDKRWSARYKKLLLSSRMTITQSLIELINRLDAKPAAFISASAIGYYGNSDDTVFDEQTLSEGGFTHELCQQWEQVAQQAQNAGVRTCIARLGVVLGRGGGMIKRVLLPFKAGLGGKLGRGTQILSWVHLDDVVRAFDVMISNDTLEGVFNLTAPNPVSNAEFTKALGQALHRPTLCAMPAPMVKLLFGEMGDTLLLNGQPVVPSRLQDAGFTFSYPTIHEALGHCV